MGRRSAQQPAGVGRRVGDGDFSAGQGKTEKRERLPSATRIRFSIQDFYPIQLTGTQGFPTAIRRRP